MKNQAIFDSLEVGQYCTFKNKYTDSIGFVEGNKYLIVELQNKIQMVSFKDPSDGAITDFCSEFFLKHWEI